MDKLKINDLTAYKVLSAIAIVLQILVIVAIGEFDGYVTMCGASLLQLTLFLAILYFSPCKQLYVSLFLVANWIFHCGQIACIAAGYNDVLNLDFRIYGSASTAASAFLFYLYSQSLLMLGAVVLQNPTADAGPSKEKNTMRPTKKLAWALVVTGLPFWLYVNFSKLAGAAAEGYRGVYTLVIPAPIQSAAFFFEAGLLMFLLLVGKERKGATLFWFVLTIKVVLMSTGGRQDSVCFLAVWCLIYFAYLRKLSSSRFVVLVFSAVFLLFAIDAFGELRNEGFSFAALSSYLSNVSFFNMFWDSLGEFGSAFSTLVVSMTNVPSMVSYGKGGTYLAGILSVFPMLLTNFPTLKDTTLFTTIIPGTTFLGGSMLGEFYYNFGWFGLLGSFLVGCMLAWCQDRLNLIGRSESCLGPWMAVVFATFLLLFIRGYFTDAAMKITYLFVFVWVVSGVIKHHEDRNSFSGSVDAAGAYDE